MLDELPVGAATRTVTRVRLRGTSLIAPAAVASDTLKRPIGNARPDANNAEYFMKSRRVAPEPQVWFSIPSGVRRFWGDGQTRKGRKSYLFPLAAKGRLTLIGEADDLSRILGILNLTDHETSDIGSRNKRSSGREFPLGDAK